jgi:hypothetical protein
MRSLQVRGGSINTNNQTITGLGIYVESVNGGILTLGSSTLNITLFGVNISVISTINLGTSTITTTGRTLTISAAASFTNTSSTINCGSVACTAVTTGSLGTINDTSSATGGTVSIIRGSLTCTNYVLSPRTSAGVSTFSLEGSLTCTTSFSSNNSAIQNRVFIGDITNAQQSTLSAPTRTVNNVDFFQVIASGGGTWSGANLGDAGGNSGISFAAGRNLYWNLAGAQNWNANAWATTSGGTPSTANFPLAQDTAVFDNSSTITGQISNTVSWSVGSIDMGGRTTAMSFSPGIFRIHGSWTNGAGTSIIGTTALQFFGGTPQTITSAGKIFANPITVISSSTLTLSGALTITNTFTLQLGTLNLNSNTLTANTFNFNNTNVKAIQFGTGNITLPSSGTTIIGNGTNFSYTGTPVINISNNTSVSTGISLSNFTQATAFDFNFTIGAYQLSFSGQFRNVDMTGFQGSTAPGNISSTHYGNLVISSTVTWGASTGSMTFAATSGIQTIQTNGVPINQSINISCSTGVTFRLIDNLEIVDTITYNSGILDLNNKILSSKIFNSNNSNVRTIAFGTTGYINVSSTGSVINIQGTNLIYTGLSKINVTPVILKQTFIETTSTPYTIPSDFASLVSIEAFGSGGAAASGGILGGSGGGAYAKTTSVTGLVAGGTAYVSIGISNEDTWFNTVSNAPPTTSAQGVLAKGGSAATSSTGALGGQASASVGDLKNSGGSGGNGASAPGGGGGAGGPGGAGGNGGNGQSGGLFAFGGGGGGGAGTIGPGGNASGSTRGEPGQGNKSDRAFGLGGTSFGTSYVPSDNSSIEGGYFVVSSADRGSGGGGSASGRSSSSRGGRWGGGVGGAKSGQSIGVPGPGAVVLTYIASGVDPTTVTLNSGFTETNALNVNYTIGAYSLTDQNLNVYRNLSYAGFAGTINNTNRTIYGGVTYSNSATHTAGTGVTSFVATSGTHSITSNGSTLDYPITIGAAGSASATFLVNGALTLGSTRALTFVNGTLKLTADTTTTAGSFITSGTTLKYLNSSISGTQATISDASSTNIVTYLSVKDSNSEGGAMWNAEDVTNVNEGNNTGWVGFVSNTGGGSSNFFLFF